jgi:hypothetical protein
MIRITLAFCIAIFGGAIMLTAFRLDHSGIAYFVGASSIVLLFSVLSQGAIK